MDYDLDLIAGQTIIRFWLCRVDDNGLPVAADAKPTTATVDKNGTTLTGGGTNRTILTISGQSKDTR